MKDVDGYKVGRSAELLEWMRQQGYDPLERAVFDIEDVPPALRSLAPLAERWGIGDDAMRDRMVSRATRAEWTELVEQVLPLNNLFDDWLAAPDVDYHKPAYSAYTCLRMAAEYADGLLERG